MRGQEHDQIYVLVCTNLAVPAPEIAQRGGENWAGGRVSKGQVPTERHSFLSEADLIRTPTHLNCSGRGRCRVLFANTIVDKRTVMPLTGEVLWPFHTDGTGANLA